MKKKNLLLIGLAALILFIIIAIQVIFQTPLTNLDKKLNIVMPNIENPNLVSFFSILGIIFDAKVLTLVVIILALFLWILKLKKEAYFTSITMIISALITLILKDIFHIARPLNILIQEVDNSFPSGHASIIVIFTGLLTYLIFNKIKNKTIRGASICISIFLILLISFSRLYLNAHWLSDVLGGFCIGAFILSLAILIKETLEKY
jgi:undecaprenyl-diphosphatase